MSKMPQIIKNIFLGIGIGIYILSLLHYPVYSNTLLQLQEEITKKEKEIAEKESVLEGVERRIKEISSSNYSLSQKINLLNEEIQTLEKNIEETEGEIEEKVKGIEEKKGQLEKTKVLIDDISGDLYIQSRYKLTSFFLNGANWFTIVESLYVRKSAISTLKKEIEKIGGEFSSLAESKAELDKEKEDLDKQREGLDEAHRLLAEEKAKVQAELSKEVASKSGLSAQIGGIKKELSQLQNYLMMIRSGGAVITAGSLISTNSLGSYQNFLNVAPSGSFGVFSFGAFTHRNGMSQYGAKARADAGQSAETILKDYYPGTTISPGIVNTNGVEEALMTSINVNGYGSLRLEEEYLLGIKEMPESWSIEALKAQAIAARTFAVWYVNNGEGREERGTLIKSICTTENCQVFSTPLKVGAWKIAVEQTRGQIMVDAKKQAIKAEYASIHGGWGNDVGWDTTDRSGEGDWVSRAWGNLSGYSLFYRNWFDYNTETKSYTPCPTHPNPWLTQAEMADLLNTYKYWSQGAQTSGDDRIISVDFPTCFKNVCVASICGYNANPYSMDEMKSLVSNPVTSISSVTTINSGGKTDSVIFETNAGRIEITGENFKKIFTLRAPGHYSMPQKGFWHFNVVMK
jgi:predicted  nucleic acid-binding Zn-ribbon protein